jgi:hypothetical protein
MATFLVDSTPLPENGDTGWGTVLNTAIQAIDDRFTYGSGNYSLASSVTGSSLTSIGTLSSLTVSGAGSFGGNLTITGNLTVNGTTTTVNSTTVSVDDPIFTLGGDTAPASDDNKDRGIEFRWHNGSAAKRGFFGYDDSTGKFTFIPDATNTSEVFSGTKGTLDAYIDWADVTSKPDPVITVTLTGDVTGTANATLTDLGNGTISVSTTIANDAVALGTDTTGNYVQTITGTTNQITVVNSGTESADVVLSLPATINVDTSGNAATATVASAWATARSITLNGDLSGSVSIDGSANVTLTATVTAGAVALGTDTSGNYLEYLTQGTGVTVTGSAAPGASPTVSIGQDVSTTANVTFNDVIVDGDLTVNGTTTTLNTTTLDVEDNIITLNSNVSGSPTLNGGIEINRGTSADVSVRWNETTDIWEFTNDGSTYVPVPVNVEDLSNTAIVTPATGDFLRYDGSDWYNDSSIIPAVTLDVDAPVSPSNGDIFYETDTGRAYIYYDDGTSSQWVEIGAASIAAVGSNGQIQFATNGALNATANLFWDNSSGYFGVNTSSPSAALDVVGDAEISGTVTSRYVTAPGATQATSAYTLSLSDAGTRVEILFGSANTLTVPADASVNFAVGTEIVVVQAGSGATTITPDSGVTINSLGGLLDTAGQWGVVTLVKRAANTWIAYGDLA